MKTLMVGQVKIHDPKEYQRYVDAFLPILDRYHGTLVGYADRNEILEGSWEYPRTVVLQFDSKEQALRWYHSPEYQQIMKLRQNASVANVILFESAY